MIDLEIKFTWQRSYQLFYIYNSVVSVEIFDFYLNLFCIYGIEIIFCAIFKVDISRDYIANDFVLN